MLGLSAGHAIAAGSTEPPLQDSGSQTIDLPETASVQMSSVHSHPSLRGSPAITRINACRHESNPGHPIMWLEGSRTVRQHPFSKTVSVRVWRATGTGRLCV